MAGPMHLFDVEIPPAWVDYNNHLNDAYHAVAFSLAGDAFLERLGLGPEGRAATKRTTYTLGLIIRYLAEAKLGERLSLSLQVLETDAKRMRVWFEARRAADGALVSTSEQVYMCVDTQRRAATGGGFSRRSRREARRGRRRACRSCDAARGRPGLDAAAAVGEFGDSLRTGSQPARAPFSLR